MTTSPRLPGLAFEVRTPPLDQTLPRMDIAAFVGFAARGPLHLPVALEDARQYQTVFGGDLPLAWDEGGARQARAQLAPTVRAFFRNGGRRCWVVRVADEKQAERNRFVLPGLVRVTKAGTEPAVLAANAPGGWSDRLEVGAALQVLTLPLLAVDGTTLTLPAGSAAELETGDLLRLTDVDGNGVVLQFVRVKPKENAPAEVELETAAIAWFHDALPAPAGSNLEARPLDGPEDLVLPLAEPPERVAAGRYALTLALDPGDPGSRTVAPGRLLQVVLGAARLTLTVEERREVLAASPAGSHLRVSGPGLCWQPQTPPQPPAFGPASRLERLRLELWARLDASTLRLGDLGLHPTHPRYLGDLPDDLQLYGPDRPLQRPPTERELLVRERLWGEVRAVRFPLAQDLNAEEPVGLLPTGLALTPTLYAGARNSDRSALEREGLADFGPGLFVDARLAGTGTRSLVAEAEFLRFQDGAKPLRGLHACLALEEATLIAAPDAVQRGWRREAPVFPRLVATPAADAVDTGEPRTFEACDTDPFEAPVLTLVPEAPPWPDAFMLRWTSGLPGAEEGRVSYEVSASRRPDFVGATSHETRVRSLRRERVDPGRYSYRVRTRWGGRWGPWSNRLTVEVPPAGRWRLVGANDYRDGALTSVQRTLLRIGAARGDLLAVLSLPDHYRDEAALAHVRNLRTELARDEPQPLDFGALYHPWPRGGSDEGFEAVPPDGAMCGVMARRATERGAWIAPANEPLKGVVELAPDLPERARLELQEARVNQLLQQPWGFLTLAASTLSLDPGLRPVGVRRLLMLLRRLALREGSHFAFEPLSAAFMRSVERTFTAFMSRMYGQGAFAGRTPAQAFRVEVASINPPRSLDLGRLIVELKVAPSQPLRFLTVRLVQTGDRELVLEERGGG